MLFRVILMALLVCLAVTKRPKDSLKITYCHCHEIYHPDDQSPDFYVSAHYLGVDYFNQHEYARYTFNVSKVTRGPTLRDDGEDGLMLPFHEKVCEHYFATGTRMCYEKAVNRQAVFYFNSHKRILKVYDPVDEKKIYFEVLESCGRICSGLKLVGDVNVDQASVTTYMFRGIRGLSLSRRPKVADDMSLEAVGN